ncbi:uncharacterized protein [Antedon mediterranea]|uniref:uncharacterized protein n=1 Tax=Antedon mediterranea TaxID=105859 RepID=UPI003AF80211
MEPKPSQRPSVYPDIIQTTPQYTDTNYPDKMHPEKLFSKDLLIAVICVFGVIMMGLVIFVFCRIYSGSKKEDVNEVMSDRVTMLNRAKRMTSFYIDAPDDRYYNLLPHRLHSTKQVVLNDYSRRPITSFKPPIKPKPNIKRIGGMCGFNTTKTMPAETKPRYVNLPLENNKKQKPLIIDSGPHDYQPIRYASSQRNRMHQVEYSTPHATHDHHPGGRAYNIRTLPRAQYSAKNHHNQFYQRFDDNVISDHSRYNQYDEISLKFSTMKRNMSQMSNCSRGSDRDGYLIPRDPLDHQR